MSEGSFSPLSAGPVRTKMGGICHLNSASRIRGTGGGLRFLSCRTCLILFCRGLEFLVSIDIHSLLDGETLLNSSRGDPSVRFAPRGGLDSSPDPGLYPERRGAKVVTIPRSKPPRPTQWYARAFDCYTRAHQA